MMRNSNADIQIRNPIFLEILQKYMKQGAFKAGSFPFVAITMREAREASGGYWDDEDDEDDWDDTLYVVAIANLTDEPDYDYGPASVEDTIGCVFRLIEDEYKIDDRILFNKCKAEVEANKDLINTSYEEIYWNSECDDPYDGWSFYFSYNRLNEDGGFDVGSETNAPELSEEDPEKDVDDGFGVVEFEDDGFEDEDEDYDDLLSWEGDYPTKAVECLKKDSIPDVRSTVVASKDKKVKAKGFLRCEYLTDVCLEEGIEEIGDSAFSGCRTLPSIRIPGTVKKIGRRAFAPCNATQTIQVSDQEYDSSCKVTWHGKERTVWRTIGENVSCESLLDVVLEEGVKIIGKSAFEDCCSLQSITLPSTIEYIGSYAFYGCKALKGVGIPSCVKCIGYHAFEGCNVLQSIVLPESMKEISDYTFRGCAELRKVEIPRSVKIIGAHAFEGCKKLSSVIIRGSLDKIGECAFAEIGNEGNEMFEITINGDCDTIDDYAFENTKNLRRMNVKGNIEYLGKYAFCDSGIEELVCSGIHTIDVAAFENSCLKQMPNVTMTETFGSHAFAGCEGLTEAVIPSQIWSLGSGVFRDCKKLKKAAIEEGVTLLEDAMFAGCEELKKVMLPESLTVIGVEAFAGCKSLVGIDIPKRCKDILARAFVNCSNLRKFSIHSNVRPDTDDIFHGCTMLGEIDGDPKQTQRLTDVLKGIERKHRLTVKGNVKIVTDEYVMKQKPFTSLVIEEGVEEIDYHAFAECKKLESVRIAGSVRRIRNSAFENCKALSVVILEDGIEEIGSWAFQNCKLREITIPGSIKTIDRTAFDHCPLEKVVLCEGVKSIESGVFEKANWVEIPKSVEHIGPFSICMGGTIVVREYTREIINCAQRERLKVLLRTDEGDTQIADYSDIYEDEYNFIDPNRLQRAHKLFLEKIDDDHYRVSGGSQPHIVTRVKFGLKCDCGDYADGNVNCKHVLRVRLEKEDLNDYVAHSGFD